MKLRWVPAALSFLFVLAGCVVDPVPPGYSGKLAHITDSTTPRNDISADLFYLEKIDGFDIPQTMSATEGSHRDAGAARPVVVIGRDVPAQAATFTLVAHTRYRAAVYALTNPVYDVTGDVGFTPLAGHDYVVKGVLGADYSAVWIEDRQTGQVAGQKIEVKGSAALGTFGKLGVQ